MAMSASKVELVLSTFNALPHLRNAINAILCQTQPPARLIVQDGGSTDGTLEYLLSLDAPFVVDVDSRPDNGISQAYARGLARVSAPYVVIVSSDEMLEPSALADLARMHAENPGSVVAYGSMRIVDADGNQLQHFKPKPFFFEEILACETVPPISTCMFNRSVIGSDFFYDESRRTCPDYDFWLRLGHRFDSSRFCARETLIAAALGDRTSMSFRTEAQIQMADDKFAFLDVFLQRVIADEAVRARSLARFGQGIYCWAAEMAAGIDVKSPALEPLCRRAIELGGENGRSDRLQRLLNRTSALRAWSLDPSKPLAFLAPPSDDRKALAVADLTRSYVNADWGSHVRSNGSVVIDGGGFDWGYSWQASISRTASNLGAGSTPLWLRARFTVERGHVGLSFIKDGNICDEQCFAAAEGVLNAYMLMTGDLHGADLMVRNAGVAHSRVVIEAIEFVSAAE